MGGLLSDQRTLGKFLIIFTVILFMTTIIFKCFNLFSNVIDAFTCMFFIFIVISFARISKNEILQIVLNATILIGDLLYVITIFFFLGRAFIQYLK